MWESIILGLIQGITEWLPISSEGVLILVKVNFFKDGLTIGELIGYAVFLHLGTFLSALLYFRKDVFSIFKKENKKPLKFYIISTVISGIIGLLILLAISNAEQAFVVTGKTITIVIGITLLITAVLQFMRKKYGARDFTDLKTSDGVTLGIMQGISIIPGLSRSGLTISTLLLRNFNESVSLKLSFIMSLPVILVGNIVLNFNNFYFSFESIIALIFSFIFGLLTIHFLLKLANKINFAWFVLIFGLLTIGSVLFT